MYTQLQKIIPAHLLEGTCASTKDPWHAWGVDFWHQQLLLEAYSRLPWCQDHTLDHINHHTEDLREIKSPKIKILYKTSNINNKSPEIHMNKENSKDQKKQGRQKKNSPYFRRRLSRDFLWIAASGFLFGSTSHRANADAIFSVSRSFCSPEKSVHVSSLSKWFKAMWDDNYFYAPFLKYLENEKQSDDDVFTET